MANSWITHVREFAIRKKMKYTDALKSADCKAEYQENKPKSNDDIKKDINKVIIKKPKTNKEVVMLKPVELTKEMKSTIIPDISEMKIKKPRVRSSRIIKETSVM